MSPPNIVASLVQWRALAHLISCIGESKFNAKWVKINKVRIARDIVSTCSEYPYVQVELASGKSADKAKSKEKPTKSTKEQTHKKPAKQRLVKAKTVESALAFRPLSVAVTGTLEQASAEKVPQGKGSMEKKEVKEDESSKFVAVDSLSPNRGGQNRSGRCYTMQ